MEAARAEVEMMLADVGETRMEQTGACGQWSVKEVIARFSEWDRWNFAQLRAAFTGAPPSFDGWRPDYPPEFEQLLPADERNRLIYEVSQKRSVEEVLSDFRAVVSGFMDWLRTRSVDNVRALVGWDWTALNEASGNGRIARLQSEVPEVHTPAPLWRHLVCFTRTGSFMAMRFASGLQSQITHNLGW